MSRSTSSESIFTTVPATRLPSSNSTMVASIASANEPSRSSITTMVSSASCSKFTSSLPGSTVSTADVGAVSAGSPFPATVPGSVSDTWGFLLCRRRGAASTSGARTSPLRRSSGAKATGNGSSRKARGVLVPGRGTSVLRFRPVRAEADLDLERDAQLGRVLHDLDHERLHLCALGERNLEHELVVHGQHHPAFELRLLERAVEVDHRELEDVGRGSLHGRVLRHALPDLADAEVVGRQLWELTAPAEERGGEPARLRFANRLGHVARDVGERGEVRIEDLAGLVGGDVEPLRKAVGLHAVREAVVDDLGEPALELVDLLLGHVEDARRGGRVHVGAPLERVDEPRVFGEVR